jgi:predicted nuclease of predicted toxin-antitoxin system
MTTRFVVDEQLPVALAEWLRWRGYEAAHVSEFGLEQASDTEIARHAVQTSAVLLTKDADFLRLRLDGLRIVWICLGNATTPTLIAALGRAFPEIEACLSAGQMVIEVA